MTHFEPHALSFWWTLGEAQCHYYIRDTHPNHILKKSIHIISEFDPQEGDKAWQLKIEALLQSASCPPIFRDIG